MEDKLKELSEIELFSGLSREDLSFVAGYCLPKKFRKGEVLFYEGEEANCLYLIMEGDVEIWSDFREKERDLLAVNSEKCIVGEMALIDSLPRSATLIAGSRVRTYYINREKYEDILLKCPCIAVIIMKSLSRIVRKSNQSYVTTLREQNKKIESTYQELIATQEKLHREEKLATMGQFSSMILHDIKNPVSVIKSYSELAIKKMGEVGNEKISEYFTKIIGETKKLNFLAADLLDFSKGGISLNYSIIELTSFLEKILHDQQALLSAKAIQVNLECLYDGVILIDADRFERVVINLLNNSRRAVSRGGEIHIKTWENQSSLNLLISDNGCGMSQETLDHIFEPFYSQSGKGGTGLGMVIIKNIVEVHDGSLQVESLPDQGSQIHITLPLNK
jgi:signal transduction histidine kinase